MDKQTVKSPKSIRRSNISQTQFPVMKSKFPSKIDPNTDKLDENSKLSLSENKGKKSKSDKNVYLVKEEKSSAAFMKEYDQGDNESDSQNPFSILKSVNHRLSERLKSKQEKYI